MAQRIKKPVQAALPGTEAYASVAEVVWLECYHRFIGPLDRALAQNTPFKASFYDMACLLLKVEHAGWLGIDKSDLCEQAIAKLGKLNNWHDQLVWQLHLEVGTSIKLPISGSLGILAANVNHHNSGIRLLMLEIAWICRPYLPRAPLVEPLCENLADKLLYVEESFTVLQSLFSQPEELAQALAAYQPSARRKDQYEARVSERRERGYGAIYNGLHATEDQVRRLIEVVALRRTGSVSSSL